ncbi:hypothetical protein NQ317_001744 [Molorchus minor]|uniref:THAP-type domain-containing protein n=1 Tax=Molorchus minor TaxID=1323400 RepID=A0ABQ9JVT5_9CUCU|nr:hypothetical protein NQ317_001744 [Molorchus minor]
MNSSYYKYCIVPQCKGTTIKTPNKLFIYVPNNEQVRKKWLKLARRDDVHSLSTNSRMYFYADHFDLFSTCNFVNLTSKATLLITKLLNFNVDYTGTRPYWDKVVFNRLKWKFAVLWLVEAGEVSVKARFQFSERAIHWAFPVDHPNPDVRNLRRFSARPAPETCTWGTPRRSPSSNHSATPTAICSNPFIG